MKNSLFFGIVCLNLIFQSGVRAEFAPQEKFEKVNSAIEVSDVLMVENFLKGYTLKKQEHDDLLEKAITVLKEKEQRIKLLKSPWDLAKFSSGTVLTAVGAFTAFLIAATLYVNRDNLSLKDFFIRQEDKKANYPAMAFMLSSPLSLGSGIFLATKGWKCSTALNRCENAKKIKGLIEGAQVT